MLFALVILDGIALVLSDQWWKTCRTVVSTWEEIIASVLQVFVILLFKKCDRTYYDVQNLKGI